MNQNGVSREEARDGYSAFHKMLGQMKSKDKLKHAKELNKIRRVIQTVKFGYDITAPPKAKPTAKKPAVGDTPANG